MGYCSNVRVFFYKKFLTEEQENLINETIKEIRSQRNEYIKDEKEYDHYMGFSVEDITDPHNGTGVIKICWDWLKWYSGENAEMECLNRLFNQLPEISYSYVREGEETGDIEIIGNEDAIQEVFDFSDYEYEMIGREVENELDKFNNWARAIYGIFISNNDGYAEIPVSFNKVKKRLDEFGERYFTYNLNEDLLFISTESEKIFDYITDSDLSDTITSFYRKGGYCYLQNENIEDRSISIFAEFIGND